MSPAVRHWLGIILASAFTGLALSALAYKTGYLDMRTHELVCINGTSYAVFRSGVTIVVNPDGSYAQCAE